MHPFALNAASTTDEHSDLIHVCVLPSAMFRHCVQSVNNGTSRYMAPERLVYIREKAEITQTLIFREMLSNADADSLAEYFRSFEKG